MVSITTAMAFSTTRSMMSTVTVGTNVWAIVTIAESTSTHSPPSCATASTTTAMATQAAKTTTRTGITMWNAAVTTVGTMTTSSFRTPPRIASIVSTTTATTSSIRKTQATAPSRIPVFYLQKTPARMFVAAGSVPIRVAHLAARLCAITRARRSSTPRGAWLNGSFPRSTFPPLNKTPTRMPSRHSCCIAAATATAALGSMTSFVRSRTCRMQRTVSSYLDPHDLFDDVAKNRPGNIPRSS